MWGFCTICVKTNLSSFFLSSFTVHTGAGLIVPEIQDDGQVNSLPHKKNGFIFLLFYFSFQFYKTHMLRFKSVLTWEVLCSQVYLY